MLAMACCSSLAIIAPEWIGPAPWASRGSDATLKQYAPILCVPPSCVEAPLGLHRYRSSRGHPGPEPRVPTTSERRRVAAAYKPRTSDKVHCHLCDVMAPSQRVDTSDRLSQERRCDKLYERKWGYIPAIIYCSCYRGKGTHQGS